jgi:hypothetical protein
LFPGVSGFYGGRKTLYTTEYTHTTNYTQYKKRIRGENYTMFNEDKPRHPPSHIVHKKRTKRVRVIVKGYMRPDGSSYHVVIPKQIRQMMELEGGEYFLMSASSRRDEIRLRRVDFFNDEDEGSNSSTK